MARNVRTHARIPTPCIYSLTCVFSTQVCTWARVSTYTLSAHSISPLLSTVYIYYTHAYLRFHHVGLPRHVHLIRYSDGPFAVRRCNIHPAGPPPPPSLPLPLAPSFSLLCRPGHVNLSAPRVRAALLSLRPGFFSARREEGGFASLLSHPARLPARLPSPLRPPWLSFFFLVRARGVSGICFSRSLDSSSFRDGFDGPQRLWNFEMIGWWMTFLCLLRGCLGSLVRWAFFGLLLVSFGGLLMGLFWFREGGFFE